MIVGVGMIISNIKKFIIVDTVWIILCFALWFISLYISIHKRNEERRESNRPKPVYLTKP